MRGPLLYQTESDSTTSILFELRSIYGLVRRSCPASTEKNIGLVALVKVEISGCDEPGKLYGSLLSSSL
jgi:hypothetical protein